MQMSSLVLHAGLPLGALLFVVGGALLVWAARRGFRDDVD
jgi:hypothetical protein